MSWLAGWFDSSTEPVAEKAAQELGYTEQITAEVQALINSKNADGKSTIPFYNPATRQISTIALQAMRRLSAVSTGVQRLEVRNTGRYFRGGGFGESFMRGFLGRRNAHLLIGSPTRVAEKEQRVTATGQLIVTDKAVVFEGDTKNERLTWRQIADVELLADGVQISKRTGPRRIYHFTRLDPKFAAVLYAMSKRVD